MPNISKPIFVVPYDLGAITTGNQASGFPATSLNRHRDTGLVWKSSGSANVWVRCNLGATRAIDFCSLTAANAVHATTIRLRLGASQAAVDGGAAPYDSGVLPFIYNDGSSDALASNNVFHSHLELPSVQSYQWARVDIGSHSGDFQANSLVLGLKSQPSRFYDTDFEYGTIQLGSIDFNRNGVPDEKPGGYQRSLKFSMSWLNEAEFETSFRPLIERAAGMPLFLCFDPGASLYRNRKTYLGYLEKPPFTKGAIKPGYFTQEWQMRSVI